MGDLVRLDVRALLESIGTEDVVDLRDRAILSLMLYTFARVGPW